MLVYILQQTWNARPGYLGEDLMLDNSLSSTFAMHWDFPWKTAWGVYKLLSCRASL